jgi:hypothetical protein
VFGTYLAVALTHALREANPGPPWQHTLFVLDADLLRGDTLDRLCDACESAGSGLVLAYRAIPPHVRQRLGRGNAAVETWQASRQIAAQTQQHPPANMQPGGASHPLPNPPGSG